MRTALLVLTVLLIGVAAAIWWPLASVPDGIAADRAAARGDAVEDSDVATRAPDKPGHRPRRAEDSENLAAIPAPARPVSPTTGRVVDPHGNPVAGASIVCRARGSGDIDRRVETDALGRFEVRPTLDRCELVAEHVAWAPSRVVVVQRTGQLDDLELTLREFQTIQGSVVSSEGRPIVDAAVEAVTERVAFELHGRFRAAHRGRSASTDQVGRFRIERLHPDTRYTVYCDAPSSDGLLARYGVDAGARGVTFQSGDPTLRTPRVHGVARRPDGPLPRFHYRVWRWFGARWRCSSTRTVRDAAGRFEIEGLRPSMRFAIEILLEDSHLTGPLLGPFVATRHDRELRARVSETSRIVIETRSAAGKPVPGVALEIERLTGAITTHHPGLRTDAGGVCGPLTLQPGRYRLRAARAHGAGPRATTREVHLQPTQLRGITLTVGGTRR